MINYKEEQIYKKIRGLIVSAIRKKSSINTVIKTVKTELKNSELTKIGISNMFDEVYLKSVEPFNNQERNEIFDEIKKEINM